MPTSKNPLPERHLLYCGRCFNIRERIVGLPSDIRRIELQPGEYAHFVKRMCFDNPTYAGVLIGKRDETR